MANYAAKLLVAVLVACCAPTSARADIPAFATLKDAVSFIAADSPWLQYTGRVARSGSQVLWQWPGVKVAANLECPAAGMAVQVHISIPEFTPPRLPAYRSFETEKYNVLVNGIIVGNFTTSYKSTSYNLTLPASSAGMRLLEVVKNSELTTIPVFWSISENSPAVMFNGITVPSSCTLSAPPERPERRLEFIGDSITCGFGNLASSVLDKVKCLTPTSGGWVGYEDFGLSWPSLVSREFNAEMHTECISQIGITRNGDTAAKTTLFNMSHYLHRTLPTVTDATSEWDYNAWAPDLAVVNLGTNDYDLAQIVHAQPSAEFFESEYTSFLVDYVSRYGSRLPAMLVACGPMTKVQCPYVAKVVENVQVAFPALKVKYLELTLPKLNGCMFHPDVDGDVLLQKQISSAIGSTTGWNTDNDMIV